MPRRPGRFTAYDGDVLAPRPAARPAVPNLRPALGLELTHRDSGFTGRIADLGGGAITLRDAAGRERSFRADPDGFTYRGQRVRLVRGPAPAAPRQATRTSASGARVARDQPAKVARANRIWVEGVHDAELLEKVWGDELRDLAVVVEPLGGIDGLADAVRAFAPGPQRRLGVLVDHLVPGSKESRIAATVTHPDVLVTGHEFVDVWAGVRPRVLGLAAWPQVPRGTEWKAGVAAALGVADPRDVWRRALAGVRSYADLETSLVGAVERLLDFLTEPA